MINYQDKFSLVNKTAVVTGGAGLLGKEVVTALAQAGAKVLILETDLEKAAIIVDELNASKLYAQSVQFDITEIAKIQENIDKVWQSVKYIDIWVNCAYPRTKDWNTIVENITSESWQENVDMHLNSYSLTSKYIAEKMKERGGSIINVSSIYGTLGPDFSLYEGTKMTLPMAYAAIKGGIITVSKYLASYFGKYKVRVNTVCPGGIFDNQDPLFVDRYNRKTPLNRMAKAEEVASTILFLASDAASYITGETIMVDGGWSAV
jgi:NAD(P)-dependent dehydrogenase (short-subunit alcohol dehydrogenase family)